MVLNDLFLCCCLQGILVDAVCKEVFLRVFQGLSGMQICIMYIKFILKPTRKKYNYKILSEQLFTD